VQQQQQQKSNTSSNHHHAESDETTTNDNDVSVHSEMERLAETATTTTTTAGAAGDSMEDDWTDAIASIHDPDAKVEHVAPAAATVSLKEEAIDTLVSPGKNAELASSVSLQEADAIKADASLENNSISQQPESEPETTANDSDDDENRAKVAIASSTAMVEETKETDNGAVETTEAAPLTPEKELFFAEKESVESPPCDVTAKPTEDEDDDNSPSLPTSPNDSDSDFSQEESSRSLMGSLRNEITADLSHMDQLEDELAADMTEAASVINSISCEDGDDDLLCSSPIKLEEADGTVLVTATPDEIMEGKMSLPTDSEKSTVQEKLAPVPVLPPREPDQVYSNNKPVSAPAATTAPTKPAPKASKKIQELQQLCASLTRNKHNQLWTCNLCDIQKLKTQDVKSHCLGKRHKAAVAQQQKQANEAAKTPVKEPEKNLDQERMDFHRNVVEETAKTDPRYALLELQNGAWSCTLCGTENLQMNDVHPHCRGKKHTASHDTCQQVSSFEFAQLTSGSWSCTLCDVHSLHLSDVQRHFSGKKHAAAVQKLSSSTSK